MSAIIGHHGLLLNDAGDAGVGQRTRWRIYVTAVDGGSAVSINEIEMRDSPGGADLCNGGTADRSSTFDANRSQIYAFDNNTGAGPNFWGSAGNVPQWISYQFPTAVIINEVTIQARNDGNTFGQSPNNFEIQSSTNGTAWDTEWTVTGSTGWAAGETRTFTRP